MGYEKHGQLFFLPHIHQIIGSIKRHINRIAFLEV